ncbi:MAG: hypothetical protein LBQ68_04655, partial [Clostridiales bacterium]|nr:hypothetical protein [Clostridiales bacterium]
ELYEHVKDDTSRPLLNVENPLEEIRRLFSEREAMYLSAADFIINCSGKSIERLVDEVRHTHENSCNKRSQFEFYRD